MANGNNQEPVVDIDQFLTPEYLAQVPDAPQPEVKPMPAQPYYQDDSDNIIKNNMKNYLVSQGVNKNTIDTLLGAPGSWRDRFFTTIQLGNNQVKVPALGRIFNPDFDGIEVAKNYYNIDVRASAPTGVIKDSQYLPPDSYFYGVQGLLKEQYPDVAIKDFDVKKDPVTDKLTYINPEDGKRRYVNAPGMDLGDFIGFVEPMIIDILGAGAGLLSEWGLRRAAVTPGGRAAVSTASGAATMAALELGTDLPTSATLPLAVTSGLVTYKYPVVGLTAQGAATAHFVWRYNNLQGLKERGLLNEKYTDDEILSSALKESGMVYLADLGASGAFSTIGRLFGGNPLDVLPGSSYDQFEEAYKNIKKKIDDPTTPPTEKAILEKMTTQDIARAADLEDEVIPDTFLIRAQQTLDEAATKSSKQGQEIALKLSQKQNLINKRYGEFFDEAGIDQGIFTTFDPVPTKVLLGENLYKTLNLDSKQLTPQLKKLYSNRANIKAEPEKLFNDMYAPGKISIFKEVFETASKKGDTESIQLMKELGYDDFLRATSKNGKFQSGQLDTYLRSHGPLMETLYSKEMVDGLKTYNNFIKKIDNGNVRVEGYDNAMLSKVMNGIARAYTGIFTVKGRVMTAVGQGRTGARENQYIKLINDPEEMIKAIQSKGFYDDPKNIATFGLLGTGYYLNGVLTDKGELADVPSVIPLDDINLNELLMPVEEDKEEDK